MEPSRDAFPTSSVGLGAFLVLLGAVARWLAALGEPWLDEIWTLDMARSLSSPWDVLTEFTNHNNHPLHTLLVAGVGHTDRWWAYRLPSLVAGVASVIGFGLVLRRRGPATWLAGLALAASSVWLIHYASEARGYSLCLAFALAAFTIHDPLEGRRRDACAPAFWACVLLGVASHVMFVFAWAALLAGRLGEALDRPSSLGSLLLEGLRWHAPPALAVGGVWLLYLRDYEVFGGPEVPLSTTLAAAASLAVGFPMLGPLRALGAGLFAALACAGLLWAFSRSRARGFFYAGGIFVVPALTVALSGGEFLAPRYFLVSVVLFVLLMAELAGALTARGRSGRTAAGLLVAGLVGANLLQCVPVWKHGRGQYLEAFASMAESPGSGIVRVGTDHVLRSRSVRSYFAVFDERARRVRFVDAEGWPEAGPEWYVLERSSGEKLKGHTGPPAATLELRGHAFALSRVYPSGPISGIDWALYRRVEPARAPGPGGV